MKRPKTFSASSVAGLDSPERVKYFGVIDRLRELGVGEDLPLPQIVVVGDQSSGKSSLLEGLTGFSFPIASDLCTRHATQIVLSRTPNADAMVNISIIPGPSALDDENEKKRILSFARSLQEHEFNSLEFAKILDEAAACMGLPQSTTTDLENLERRFSDHILKVELSGPDHHHLSVVDVPGLFHNPTKYQTKEDLEIIRNLITDYITDSRTIILAVMDARNNLANQEVFRMARAADPEGNRTVGIITKCDALQAGDEPVVLKIAQNMIERLQHGWFVVRNRSTKEIQAGTTIEQRHENEKRFFSSTPWNELPKDHVGIQSLKPFLGQLLYEHIRKEFPSLVKEIESLYRDVQKSLDGLGAPRQTSIEQRQFLTRIAMKFQRNVSDALTGNYDADLESQSELKLRMHLRILAEDFQKTLSSSGHAYVFQNADGTSDSAYTDSQIPRRDIFVWIRVLYRDSRGSELPGTVNPAVMETLFRQQSAPWKSIAEDYLKKAENAVELYSQAECNRLISDDNVRRALQSRLQANTATALAKAEEKLQSVLDDERTGILQTINHYFADTLQNIRQDRVLCRLRATGLRDGVQVQTVDLQAIAKAAHLSNEDQAVNDIHDVLKAYYKVALKRFMDNVLIAVVERHLLGPDGPIKNLNPELVGSLSDADLYALAAESYSVSSKRVDINHKAARLKKALEIAKSV